MSKHLAEQLARTIAVAALPPRRRDALRVIAIKSRVQPAGRDGKVCATAGTYATWSGGLYGLASELEIAYRSACRVVAELVAAGFLVRLGRGAYAVPTPTDWGAIAPQPLDVSNRPRTATAGRNVPSPAPSHETPIGLLKLSGRARAREGRPARARESREPNQGLSAVTAAWNATCTPLPALRTKALRTAPEVLERAALALEAVDGDIAHLGRAFQRAARDPYYRARCFSFQTVCRHLDRWLDPPAPANGGAAPPVDVRAQVYALLAAGDDVDPAGWRPELRPAVTAAVSAWQEQHR